MTNSLDADDELRPNLLRKFSFEYVDEGKRILRIIAPKKIEKKDMAKIIRPRYPLELSVGLLILIFALSFFLSGQLFQAHANESNNVYLGMFLVSTATVIMLLVLWEEFLFPIHIKPTDEGAVFRNHRNKLKTQLLIYLIIPVIFVFIYTEYEVALIRFIIWSSICVVLPVAGKLISGIRNYNDFLSLTNDTIEYKNNEDVGKISVSDVQEIVLVRDKDNILHKMQLTLRNGKDVLIDIDEMELDAYCMAIDQFAIGHYKNLVKVKKVAEVAE